MSKYYWRLAQGVHFGSRIQSMTHVQQHQRRQQADTSLTKVGQANGRAQMQQCASKWLKPTTGTGCLS